MIYRALRARRRRARWWNSNAVDGAIYNRQNKEQIQIECCILEITIFLILQKLAVTVKVFIDSPNKSFDLYFFSTKYNIDNCLLYGDEK